MPYQSLLIGLIVFIVVVILVKFAADELECPPTLKKAILLVLGAIGLIFLLGHLAW